MTPRLKEDPRRGGRTNVKAEGWGWGVLGSTVSWTGHVSATRGLTVARVTYSKLMAAGGGQPA